MTLEATLDATANGNVEFEFTVRNTGDETVELTFMDGQTADIVVSEEGSDEEFWRWSDRRMFTQAVESWMLEPGADFTKQYTWETPESGEYVARASLESDRDVSAETTFSV